MEPVPYLASLSWYSSWAMARLGLCDAPQLPQNPNRALIRGAWGEQTLSVPIEGGRRRLACVPYDRLRLSEHGNWRHAHWQSLVLSLIHI